MNKKNIPQVEEGWGNISLPGLSDEDLYSKNWNQISGIREFWKSASDEYKIQYGKRMSEQNLTINAKDVKEIELRIWNSDRGVELYKRLALEFDTTLNIVTGIANGNHPLSTISKEEWKLLYSEWHKKHGYNKTIYIVRSPGNDLLKYYDQQNLLRGKQTKLSPSEIFDIRYRWLDKSDSAIKAYCQSKNIVVDNSMYKTYAKKTYGWLIDEPHKEWEFDSLVTLSEFLFERIGRKSDRSTVGGAFGFACIDQEMIWSQKELNIAGWSFIKKT